MSTKHTPENWDRTQREWIGQSLNVPKHNTKHTPGPWKAEPNFMGPDTYGDGDSIPIFPAMGGVAIADIVARSGDGLSRPDVQAQAEANARLIAAAPDLLGWLKFAQEHLESYRRYSEAMASELGRGHVPSSQFSPAYLAAAIEQVINKATESQQ